MKPETILRAYEQLSAALLSPESEPTDQSIVICDQNGFRLVLTKADEEVHFDVEVSRPRLEIVESDDSDTISVKCREAALKSISHLEFLVCLVDHGFSLSVEETEFLWIASIILKEPPSHTLLELFRELH
jgi:hypothetical protein